MSPSFIHSFIIHIKLICKRSHMRPWDIVLVKDTNVPITVVIDIRKI
jgi:hypothetical protein